MSQSHYNMHVTNKNQFHKNYLEKGQEKKIILDSNNQNDKKDNHKNNFMRLRKYALKSLKRNNQISKNSQNQDSDKNLLLVNPLKSLQISEQIARKKAEKYHSQSIYQENPSLIENQLQKISVHIKSNDKHQELQNKLNFKSKNIQNTQEICEHSNSQSILLDEQKQVDYKQNDQIPAGSLQTSSLSLLQIQQDPKLSRNFQNKSKSRILLEEDLDIFQNSKYKRNVAQSKQNSYNNQKKLSELHKHQNQISQQQLGQSSRFQEEQKSSIVLFQKLKNVSSDKDADEEKKKGTKYLEQSSLFPKFTDQINGNQSSQKVGLQGEEYEELAQKDIKEEGSDTHVFSFNNTKYSNIIHIDKNDENSNQKQKIIKLEDQAQQLKILSKSQIQQQQYIKQKQLNLILEFQQRYSSQSNINGQFELNVYQNGYQSNKKNN